MTDSSQIKKNRKSACKRDSHISVSAAGKKSCREEADFSLVEAVIALIILLIVVSGVFATFAYAVNYNAGNNSRSQALAVLQQEAELMRSAKFTSSTTDNYTPGTPDDGRRDITAGVKATRIATSANGFSFKVQTTVVDISTTLKEITITVMLDSPTLGWQTAVPATVVLRRVQAN